MRDRRDALPVGLTLVHAAALLLLPSAGTVAVGLWWNANAISHQHVHRRFFERRWADALFSAWLSLLLGLPQRLWAARHLAHHGLQASRASGTRQRTGADGVADTPKAPWRARFFRSRRLRAVDPGLLVEVGLAGSLWLTLAATAPAFLATTYAPGFALGLLLCHVHGRYEHAGGTTSCHGRLWNVLFLNDGYHVEHHAHPGAHARDLPALRRPGTRCSRWPPVLRFLDARPTACDLLDRLERLVLRWPALRRPVLAAHRRALVRLLRDHLPAAYAPRRILVVGGGLFPRSAILLAEIFPRAEIVVLDAEPSHLDDAASLLPHGTVRESGRFTPGETLACDVAVLPLALRGERTAVHAAPPAPVCIVHDWLWRANERSTVVAWWLLKRANLVLAGERLAPAWTAADPEVGACS